MKNERLFSALGEIKDTYIEQSEYPIKRKNNIIKWGFVAACFGIVTICGSLLLQSPKDRVWPIKEITNSNSSPEIGKVRNWEDLSISEKYPELPFHDVMYSTTVNSIEEAQIEDLITQTMLTGFDEQANVEHQITALVYSIRDISSDAAVAILFEGYDGFYTYINPYYQPSTLGQFISDLNLNHTISFGSAWYDEKRSNGSTALIEFVDLSDTVIWEMLLSDTSLPAIKDFDSHNFISLMSISVDIPLLGYQNISLSVTEDGYLTTNILNTGKAFFLGKEKVNQFVTYVIENCKGYEIVHTNDQPGIPE